MTIVTIEWNSGFLKRLEQLNGEHETTYGDLLPPEFISRYSDYPSLDELLAASGFSIEGEDDLSAIPDAGMDAFISSATQFATWDEMVSAALAEFVVRQLGD